jgi:hypothetical protein
MAGMIPEADVVKSRFMESLKRVALFRGSFGETFVAYLVVFSGVVLWLGRGFLFDFGGGWWIWAGFAAVTVVFFALLLAAQTVLDRRLDLFVAKWILTFISGGLPEKPATGDQAIATRRPNVLFRCGVVVAVIIGLRILLGKTSRRDFDELLLVGIAGGFGGLVVWMRLRKSRER